MVYLSVISKIDFEKEIGINFVDIYQVHFTSAATLAESTWGTFALPVIQPLSTNG